MCLQAAGVAVQDADLVVRKRPTEFLVLLAQTVVQAVVAEEVCVYQTMGGLEHREQVLRVRAFLEVAVEEVRIHTIALALLLQGLLLQTAEREEMLDVVTAIPLHLVVRVTLLGQVVVGARQVQQELVVFWRLLR